MRPAFLAVVLIAGLAASLACPRGRMVVRGVYRFGHGGRWNTPQGALFCYETRDLSQGRSVEICRTVSRKHDQS